MTKRRSTKNALISSVLALVLCFTMLLGTTYAWFTDSVTSATNIIAAGNLDIELYHTNSVDTLENVKGNTNLFDDVTPSLWEPGAMAFEEFTVANEGTLALKYQFALNVANATVINGVSFAQMLKVTVVEEGFEYTRANIEAIAADKWQTLSTFTLSGNLEAGKNDVFGVVIWWQPSENDNLFNMNNANKGNVVSVDVGVSLKAAQLMSEDDSFGNSYDGGAEWLGNVDYSWYNTTDTEFVIYGAEQLAGLAAIVNGTAKDIAIDSFAGKTVKLGCDVNLNNLNWTPMGNFVYDINTNGDGYTYGAYFAGTFDGNNYKVSNLVVNAPETSGVGLFGYVKNATIKNLTVENVDLNALSHTAAVVARANGNTTITNCHLTGDININAYWAYVAGIAGKAYALTLENCTVTPEGTGVITSENRNAVGSVLAWVEQASTISNCKATNMELTGWANIGSITGFLSQGTTMTGCYAENIVMTKTRVLGHPTIGLVAGGFSYSATKAITLKDNTVKNITLNGTHIAAPASANVLYGAEFGGNANSNFVLENNVTENVTNNLVEVTSVNSADALKNAISNAENGEIIVLAADITGVNANNTITVPAGKQITLNLDGHKLAATASKTGNQELFLVKGNMTVVNGTIELVAQNNQGWGAMATIFDVTAGGSLTMEDVTANVSGTDMNFIVHLNNWGSATLNVNNCDFTASYVAIRAFNSGYDMNTVTVKNTDFHTGRVFWVHNYTAEGKDDSTLTLDIYGNGNTTDNANPVRFGFSNAVYYDINGNVIA